jgi:hypothetical protein
MRAAVRLPGMRRACPPCPPDRTRLPYHVGRRASGRRKVRAPHRRIARPGKIARSRMQLLRRPGFQDGETCQGESASASLTDLASRDPANFPQADPIFSLKSMAPVAARNAPAGTSGRRVLPWLWHAQGDRSPYPRSPSARLGRDVGCSACDARGVRGRHRCRSCLGSRPSRPARRQGVTL